MNSPIDKCLDDVLVDEDTKEMWLCAKDDDNEVQCLPAVSNMVCPFRGNGSLSPLLLNDISRAGSVSGDNGVGDSFLWDGPESDENRDRYSPGSVADGCVDFSWLEEDEPLCGRLSPSPVSPSSSGSPPSSSGSPSCTPVAGDLDRICSGNSSTDSHDALNHSERIPDCSTGSLRRLLPNLSDDALARLTIPELERRFAGAPVAVITEMKRRRRTLLNRLYARNCRLRRACKDNSAQSEVDELRRDRDKWKARAEALMRELKSYRIAK